jgi:hypothetical protein
LYDGCRVLAGLSSWLHSSGTRNGVISSPMRTEID